MQRIVLILFLVYTLREATSKNIEHGRRQKRWFGYSYTATIIRPKYITSLIPSSCVQVEPSLPPCRNVRQIHHFPNFAAGRSFGGNSNELDDGQPTHQEPLEPSIQTTPLGWGEYLGIVAPTVTTIAYHMETTTVMDPRTVVTFSVRGCKPSRLPLDLATCPQSSVPIIPTPASKEVMTSTVFKPEITTPGSVSGSEQELTTTFNALPTQQLIPK